MNKPPDIGAEIATFTERAIVQAMVAHADWGSWQTEHDDWKRANDAVMRLRYELQKRKRR